MPPSRPVVITKSSQWSGQFDCSGPCQRKRLVGDEFSKKGLERHRKEGKALKCKKCVADAEAEERRVAKERAEKKKSADDSGTANNDGSNEEEISCVTCVACQKSLPTDSFNRNQLSKGEGKSRCRACVEKAVQQEAASSKEGKEKKLEDAREAVRLAEKSGDVKEKLAAESKLAALEAEVVTGLKPVKLGRGRGRGGRWSGGRGSSGRGR